MSKYIFETATLQSSDNHNRGLIVLKCKSCGELLRVKRSKSICPNCGGKELRKVGR